MWQAQRRRTQQRFGKSGRHRSIQYEIGLAHHTGDVRRGNGNVALALAPWETIPGARQRNRRAKHLATAGAIFNGTGADIIATLNVTPAQKFFRVTASDIDTDGDGLSDWEESKVGLDPNLVASDGTNNDYQRIIAALQATTNTLTMTESDPVWSSDGATPGTSPFIERADSMP